MKSITSKACLLAIVTTLILQSVSVAQIISSFGSSVTDEGSGWTYTAGTSTLSGTEAFGAYLTDASAPLSLNLSGATGLGLTAKVFTDPGSVFTITLEDDDGDLAIATFDWTSFVGANPSYTVQVNFSLVQGGFNFSDVDYWTLDSGSSGNALSATFTSLSAIPEPSTYALLGLGGLALWGLRRWKAKA